MILPTQCTPVNVNQPIVPGTVKEYPGRFYNRKSVCNLCGGLVLGTQAGKCFTGKCCICGQLYTENLFSTDSKWLRILLQALSKYDTPDVKVWSPQWASGLSLPVLEAVHESFLFCENTRPLMDILTYMAWCGRCFKIKSDRTKAFKTGPCWLAFMESSPGRPAGLKILSAREEDTIWFNARRSVRKWALFDNSDRTVAGHFLKMAPELDFICDHWSELPEYCLDDLLGERLDHTVLVNQVV